MVQVKFDENNKYYFDGDFEFKRSETIIDPKDLTPKRLIMFDWNLELPLDLHALYVDNSWQELIAEKLKQDFLKVLKDKQQLQEFKCSDCGSPKRDFEQIKNN
jgi:hypothetical protein